MIKSIQAKTILTKYKEADPWFHIKYSMNLYRGCQHQCIYCDSRSECYHIENFQDILVKENAIELLRKELSKIKEKNTIGTGSMNDPYMPVEKKYGMTRKALQVIADYKFPVHVITKGTLVLRDIDLLQEIGKVFSTVSITITTIDDELSKKLEPGAPASSERFQAIGTLSKKGITVGITLMPVIPFITDDPENISALVQKASESGAKYILPAFGMTLRDRQREYFFQKLIKYFPDEFEKYKKTYHGEYSFPAPEHRKLAVIFHSMCENFQIAGNAPEYKPESVQMNLFENSLD